MTAHRRRRYISPCQELTLGCVYIKSSLALTLSELPYRASKTIMTAVPDHPEVVLDPDADAVITLISRVGGFAVWNEAAEYPRPPCVLPDSYTNPHDSAADDDTEMRDNHKEYDDKANVSKAQDDGQTLFMVSSRHLSLASTYFHKVFSKEWDHHKRDEKGRILVTEAGWGNSVFCILMHVIHGKWRSVPERLMLDELAEMAHMTDYYDCTEVLEPRSSA
jgi:hypothetical protein